MAATKTLTTADIAEALETTPRELRKFLRDSAKGVGKGSRYALPGNAREIDKMRKQFITWGESKRAEAAEKAETPDVSEED